MVRDNQEFTVLTQSAVPTLASFLRRQESRGAGQCEESLPPSWGKVRMGAVPRQRQPPRHHPHPTAVAARPSCVLPAKAGIQTSGAPPPPTPAASQTSLPHRRGDSRTARPATAPTPPPSPAPDRRRSPPLMRHTGESRYPHGRRTPTTNPVASPTPLPHRRAHSRPRSP